MPIRAESSREEEAGRRVMDERLRIARELHDVVAYHIAVVSVHAGAADHVLRNEPDRVWPVLGHIRTAADTVLEEIKSVISVLRDPDEVHSTEPAPGVERLQDLLAGLRTMGFAVQHQQYGQPRSLPAVVNLAAYRIVQEALTNAHRYGDGDATFDLGYTADSVCIDVTNRIAGAGSRRSGSSGFGLLGMRERAAAAHGTITAGPVAGNLFRVEATRRIGADERLAGVRVLVLTTFDNEDNVIYALQERAVSWARTWRPAIWSTPSGWSLTARRCYHRGPPAAWSAG